MMRELHLSAALVPKEDDNDDDDDDDDDDDEDEDVHEYCS